MFLSFVHSSTSYSEHRLKKSILGSRFFGGSFTASHEKNASRGNHNPSGFVAFHPKVRQQ
jgi:hypothetical protein